MQGPLVTLLDKPFAGAGRASKPTGFLRGFGSLALSLVFLPLIPVLLVLSYPYMWVRRSLTHRSERKFAEQMKSASRFMSWDEFESAVEGSRGTAIEEAVGVHGPVRMWWTPEDTPALSPYPCDWKRRSEDEAIQFFKWCSERYTDERMGNAKFVAIPRGSQKFLKDLLQSSHYVGILSWALRARQGKAVPSDR
jgi:hypothetical protein